MWKNFCGLLRVFWHVLENPKIWQKKIFFKNLDFRFFWFFQGKNDQFFFSKKSLCDLQPRIRFIRPSKDTKRRHFDVIFVKKKIAQPTYGSQFRCPTKALFLLFYAFFSVMWFTCCFELQVYTIWDSFQALKMILSCSQSHFLHFWMSEWCFMDV